MEYKVALILLYDKDGRFLLQHRCLNAGVLPGYWAFFGGGIQPGETPQEAVVRESWEELGYMPVSPRIFKEQPFVEAGKKGYMYVYIEAIGVDKSSLELREGQGWGWFSEDEIESLKMVERDRLIIREASRFIKKELV